MRRAGAPSVRPCPTLPNRRQSLGQQKTRQEEERAPTPPPGVCLSASHNGARAACNRPPQDFTLRTLFLRCAFTEIATRYSPRAIHRALFTVRYSPRPIHRARFCRASSFPPPPPPPRRCRAVPLLPSRRPCALPSRRTCVPNGHVVIPASDPTRPGAPACGWRTSSSSSS